MDRNAIVDAALNELRSPVLAVTNQYLAIHDVKRHNGAPIIERVDRERGDGLAIVYLPVEDEQFYLAVYVREDDAGVNSVETEPRHRVYFRATSDTLDLDRLRKMTTIEPTKQWKKGEPIGQRPITYKFSGFDIEPNPEPDEFEDKMRKLLDVLERDASGVRALVSSANGYVQVGTQFHDGNGMLGGFHLDTDVVERMARLGLEIDFDLYCGGNPFRSD